MNEDEKQAVVVYYVDAPRWDTAEQDIPHVLELKALEPLANTMAVEGPSWGENEDEGADPRATRQQTTSPVDLIRSARDEGVDVTARALALQDLIIQESEKAIDVVATELVSAREQSPWAAELLVAAESLVLRDPSARARFRQLLYSYATAWRAARTAHGEAGLGAALRKYAGLVEEDDVDTFLPFLEAKLPTWTRSVALVCLENVFSVHPPTSSVSEQLRTRLLELVSMYTQVDLLGSAENAALAVQAAAAACSCSPRDAASVVARVRSASHEPLRKAVVRRLRSLLDRWRAASDSVEFAQLRQAVDSL